VHVHCISRTTSYTNKLIAALIFIENHLFGMLSAAHIWLSKSSNLNPCKACYVGFETIIITKLKSIEFNDNLKQKLKKHVQFTNHM